MLCYVINLMRFLFRTLSASNSPPLAVPSHTPFHTAPSVCFHFFSIILFIIVIPLHCTRPISSNTKRNRRAYCGLSSAHAHSRWRFARFLGRVSIRMHCHHCDISRRRRPIADTVYIYYYATNCVRIGETVCQSGRQQRITTNDDGGLASLFFIFKLF